MSGVVKQKIISTSLLSSYRSPVQPVAVISPYTDVLSNLHPSLLLHAAVEVKIRSSPTYKRWLKLCSRRSHGSSRYFLILMASPTGIVMEQVSHLKVINSNNKNHSHVNES